jgi:CMP-N,N'-diacetyllegionaminic acid synthase
MINGKSVLGIVPARAGSKGLPGKNTKDLCGKPLIAWTIEKALMSIYIDEIVVSTDSKDIADIAVRFGAVAPFLRPAPLATDEASSYSLVEHCLDFYYASRDVEFDYVVLLEPTSPLRRDTDIDQVLEKLDVNADRFDSIITVGLSKEHPSVTKRIVDEKLINFCEEVPMVYRRQDYPPAFFPFGVAYASKISQLKLEKTFYTERTTAFLIGREQQFEIDDFLDFVCIEAIMKLNLHGESSS